MTALTSYNHPKAISSGEEYDQKFTRILSIGIFTVEDFKTSNFSGEKVSFAKRIFEIRAGDDNQRRAKFEDLYGQAIKEGIARNMKRAAKLSSISLPENVFKKK